MKLWHDDCRPPPDDTWTWARTNESAKMYLLTDSVDEASLDHDLGLHGVDPGNPAAIARGIVREREKRRRREVETGADLAEWMVKYHQIPARVTIHSMNPVGAQRMAQILAPATLVVISPFTFSG